MTRAVTTAKEVFAWAKGDLPTRCELEVYLSRGRGRSVSWSEKKCEDISQADGGGVGIRVILRDNGDGGRQGFAFTTGYHKENVRKAAVKALDTARALPGDQHRKLPSVTRNPSVRAETLHDPTTFSESIPAILERLRREEDRILKKFPLLRSVLRATFGEGMGETAIVNSNGIEISFTETHSGLGVACLAEKDGERQEAGYGLSRRFKSDLEWEHIFDRSAERAYALLGGQPIPSGRIPVIFDPSVACDFLSLVSDMVCAESVQKGKSPFLGKTGQTVASENVSLVDDGTLDKGLATSPVDDEGVPTGKTPVITRGRLDHLLYDTYTALKDQTISTGNASRSGYRSSPSSGSSNFYLESGSLTREKLLGQTKGLYLYDVMGLHMADPISGDFSVGAIGAWLENGAFKTGVRGVTLAGNLIELLKNIDAVCDDLTFFGSLGSPTFRVSELTVSGQ